MSGTTAADYLDAQLLRPSVVHEYDDQVLLVGPRRPALITVTVGANEILNLFKEALTDCKLLSKIPGPSKPVKSALIAACVTAVFKTTGRTYAESVKSSVSTALGALSASPVTRDSLIVVTTYPNPCPLIPGWEQLCELITLHVNTPIVEGVTQFRDLHPDASRNVVLLDRVAEAFAGHDVASDLPWIVDISSTVPPLAGLGIPFGVHPNDSGQICYRSLIWEGIKGRLGAGEPPNADPCPN